MLLNLCPYYFARINNGPAPVEGKKYKVTIYQKLLPREDDGGVSVRAVDVLGWNSMLWQRDVVKIADGGNVLLDRTICRLHKKAMRLEQVRIIFGMPGPELVEEEKSARVLFPNGDQPRLGGCIPDGDMAKRVFVCEDCSEAYGKWRNEEARQKYKNAVQRGKPLLVGKMRRQK
jgi:hypothetical protein